MIWLKFVHKTRCFPYGHAYNIFVWLHFHTSFPLPCCFQLARWRERPIVIDPMFWSLRSDGKQGFIYRSCVCFVVDFIRRKLNYIRKRNVSIRPYVSKYVRILETNCYIFNFDYFVATSWTSRWGHSKWRFLFSTRPLYAYQGQHDLFLMSARVYSTVSGTRKENGK